ncbi:E3 ubiquitin-protein ligase RNF14-like [Dreissena polymorpha]|nr:E3 ubiquitin-protein ligase RNF14-like [Dreissena polymorpha]XP_052279932.1 E3 ubiquitin-protein ligase RNF14-like [Dreissena polymorpha]XP_052279933.1 E3 ubiquitin-protein ligase RNF14-like [Dreissena polymorpha]XP_052279934.1 E3 ubiquitin-protein ligase RNF14-like [Dreissena polymorpha]XP_052279935.1 E3 ubiquitin-protein ligase RNF14-like [Dreissena polymorpha]XP_052279936.1 E3 ubiquitin-protein ligase RNF14-like [Dreissena polymorpha]XP_052279937.1 E3 ubiquitin-protein ligase RNF14-like
MSDKEEQEDELLALTSIYDNVLKVHKEGELNGGELLALPVLPNDFKIKVVKIKKDSEKDGAGQMLTDLHHVKFLPPVLLNFLLPVDYPSNSPPQFTLSCKWLNREQLSKLCSKLDSLWEESRGSVILFQWNTFLQDELFDHLQLSSPIELAHVVSRKLDCHLDPRAIQEIASQDQLLPVILDYNKQERLNQFEKSSYSCNVCFCEKSGAHCLMFYDCDHVYCNDCMRNYFSIQIKDGNVKGLECPHDDCESQAHPAQVKKLVPPELFTKYDQLLLQTSLDMMSDITFCPRPTCQCPVLMERDTPLASCPACQFVFCTLCRLVYHGLSPCRLKADGLQKLREEYLGADKATRQLLERRYGKITIQQALEESFTNEWLKEHSKQCPSCGAHIQKIDGCNKMTCMKCRAYFCWLCNNTLSRANPYLHYNSLNSKCHNRLFEGVEMEDGFEDDDDDEDGWGWL